ncbi:M56 family metallopeptidase [Actinomadura rugatobispora]|uniref:M56 family metallopeptidase n=1 Tax=Actinomadura rugatobispora TaxID=1994 RepID=A0ABW1A9P9_9ACTN
MLVAPALVVVVVSVPADRVRPAAGVTALAWSAAAAAVATLVNLGAFTVKAAAEVPGVAHRFGLSYQTVVQDTAHQRWVPWLSAALLACGTVAAARVWRKHRRGWRFARRFAGTPGDGQVVLVDRTEIDAFAVPGRPGRIVVTTGMREALDDDQFAALVAHERAHLDAGHSRLMLVAELAGAVHPALRWVARRVSFLIERAADERAAGAVGDRRTVATAIAAAALAADRRPAADGPVRLSFARAVHPGAVPRRVAALLAPPPGRRRAWPVIVPVLLAAGSVVWTGEALYDLYELLVLAHHLAP